MHLSKTWFHTKLSGNWAGQRTCGATYKMKTRGPCTESRKKTFSFLLWPLPQLVRVVFLNLLVNVALLGPGTLRYECRHSPAPRASACDSAQLRPAGCCFLWHLWQDRTLQKSSQASRPRPATQTHGGCATPWVNCHLHVQKPQAPGQTEVRGSPRTISPPNTVFSRQPGPRTPPSCPSRGVPRHMRLTNDACDPPRTHIQASTAARKAVVTGQLQGKGELGPQRASFTKHKLKDKC